MATVRIQDGNIIKFGRYVNFGEARAMRFIKESTSIPVPEVFETYVIDGVNHIRMELIEGNTLESELQNLSQEEIDSILLELKGYIEEMRKIKGEYIGSLDEGPVTDYMFGGGPFSSEKEFNENMLRIFDEHLKGNYHIILSKMVKENHEILFTHGDIRPSNIIIRDKKIVAIIDWEYSGFYPEYWEYTKSMFGIPWKHNWLLYTEKILQPYYYENAVFNMFTRAFF